MLVPVIAATTDGNTVTTGQIRFVVGGVFVCGLVGDGATSELGINK
jgi:hypothetical protein